jgi:hypothetical protein
MERRRSMKIRLACYAACCAVLFGVSLAAAETIPLDVVGSGGGKCTNADFQLLHTVGQQVIGMVTNTDYIHEQGFWYLPWFLVTGVEEQEPVPRAYRLDQNYPNPFNPLTTIRFALVKHTHVRLQIYDAAGRLVMTVVNREMDAGEHTVPLNAVGLASGIYFYRIVADSFVRTKKMVVIR